MMKRLRIYFFVSVFVIGWWAIAFRHKPVDTSTLQLGSQAEFPSLIQPSSNTLSQIKREKLQQALSGDFNLMSHLILEWDIDAQVLQASGLHEAKRLSSDFFLQSQLLHRSITMSTPDELSALNSAMRAKMITDDAGKNLNLEVPYRRFLPQTYVAASFLLALTTTNEIVALPKKFREHLQLYPKKITDKIPLDIDRYNAEKIFLARPEIAFVARYSHPATILALESQGVELYTMKNPANIDEIAQELLNVGNIINHPYEAQLLKIFIDAAMLALDNRLLQLTSQMTSHNGYMPRLLFLNFHRNFSIPSKLTLTGQLLGRMSLVDISLKYLEEHEPGNEWMMPIDKERILNLNPDYLIIAAETPQALENDIRKDVALKQLKAVQRDHIFFVDDSIQHSPSQYIVLAYYDLIQTMVKLQ